MWKDVSDKGLKYIYQLHQGCRFKSDEQVLEEFGLTRFKSDEQVLEEFGLTQLRYNSLKSAIPREWKDFFEQNEISTFLPIPPITTICAY